MVINSFFEAGIKVERFIKNIKNVISQFISIFDERGLFGKETYKSLITTLHYS